MGASLDFRRMRPCGACGQLVPLETGCPHWQVRRIAKAVARKVKATADKLSPLEKARKASAEHNALYRSLRSDMQAQLDRAHRITLQDQMEFLRSTRKSQ